MSMNIVTTWLAPEMDQYMTQLSNMVSVLVFLYLRGGGGGGGGGGRKGSTLML